MSLNTSDAQFCVICPCRDEAQYMRRTLESIVNQTVPPTLLVVVDDGSTDGSSEILREFAERVPYLKIITRTDRGHRSVGPGVVDTFYAGLKEIDLNSFDYLCKLDLDLVLPPGYFEGLIKLMEQDEKLGTISGKAFFRESGTERIILEAIGDHVSLGMTKFYRVQCFEEIGGFVREVMWDGIDCHRARMLGWKAESVRNPELMFEHLRPMGSSEKGILRGRYRHGYGQYFMGTSFVFHLASSLKRLFHPPYVIGSLCNLWGFVDSWIRRRPRYDDPEFRRFLRRWQLLALVGGTNWASLKVMSEVEKKK